MVPAYESSTPHDHDGAACADCTTPAIAWDWVSLLTEGVLAGDDETLMNLPRAIDHALLVERTCA